MTDLSQLSDERITAYHLVGYTQWAGTCVFHRRNNCRHLVRKRMMGPFNVTGQTVEVVINPTEQRMCRHCQLP